MKKHERNIVAASEVMRQAQVRALQAHVGMDALRLLNALHLYLLGWSITEGVISRRQLMEASGFTDTRSFNRAKAQLVSNFIVTATIEGSGRGAETMWSYLSDEDAEQLRGALESLDVFLRGVRETDATMDAEMDAPDASIRSRDRGPSKDSAHTVTVNGARAKARRASRSESSSPGHVGVNTNGGEAVELLPALVSNRTSDPYPEHWTEDEIAAWEAVA